MVIPLIFNTLIGLEHFLAINERAYKCYLKCGFKDTGKSREETFLNGKYYDKLHMNILEYEFKGDYIRNKNIK